MNLSKEERDRDTTDRNGTVNAASGRHLRIGLRLVAIVLPIFSLSDGQQAKAPSRRSNVGGAKA